MEKATIFCFFFYLFFVVKVVAGLALFAKAFAISCNKLTAMILLLLFSFILFYFIFSLSVNTQSRLQVIQQLRILNKCAAAAIVLVKSLEIVVPL